jgi:hypothetical protein
MRKDLSIACVALAALLAITACQSGGTSEPANPNSGGAQSNTASKAANTNGTAGNSSSPQLTISLGGKDTPLEVKSGSYHQSVTNYSAGGKSETASEAVFFIANFDMVQAKAAGKKPENGQMVAAFTLIGASGTNDKSPLAVGTYPVRSGEGENATRFNITTRCGVVMFENGAQTDKKLATSKLQGEAKITSVADGTVSGEINVTDGESTIKGTFVARALP